MLHAARCREACSGHAVQQSGRARGDVEAATRGVLAVTGRGSFCRGARSAPRNTLDHARAKRSRRRGRGCPCPVIIVRRRRLARVRSARYQRDGLAGEHATKSVGLDGRVIRLLAPRFVASSCCLDEEAPPLNRWALLALQARGEFRVPARRTCRHARYVNRASFQTESRKHS